MGYQIQKRKAEKFKIDPQWETALMLSPIALTGGLVGFFLYGNIAVVPYIVRFLGYILVGYVAAARLHNREKMRPSRNLFNKMPSTGMLGGFGSALIAWLLLVTFLIVAEYVGIDLEVTLWGGILSGILDLLAGLLFGLLGGWIYSKLNSPKRHTKR